MTRLRRSAALLAASIAALAFAGGVQAKSFDFPQANVQVVVQADGSLLVTERLTYAFSGPFSGANRDIPLRSGESIDQVSVLENGRPFATGRLRRDRVLEPGWDVRRHAGTATTSASSGTSAQSDEVRTFEIRYRMRGVAVAYDDVVDVNLQVWGSQWDSLARAADGDRPPAPATSSARGDIRSGCAATSRSTERARTSGP